MPTVNEVLGGVLQKAIANPKTTIQSILTCLLTLVPTLLAANLIHGKAAAYAGGVLAFAKVALGMMQHDGVTIPAGTNVTQVTQVTTPEAK